MPVKVSKRHGRDGPKTVIEAWLTLPGLMTVADIKVIP